MAAGGYAARYAVGDCPNARVKLVVNEPTLWRPTVKQIAATERSVVRRSEAARSSRRVRRYWCGVSPNERRNSRLKCAGERGDVERVAVARVDQVLRAEQMPVGMDERHWIQYCFSNLLSSRLQSFQRPQPG